MEFNTHMLQHSCREIVTATGKVSKKEIVKTSRYKKKYSCSKCKVKKRSVDT